MDRLVDCKQQYLALSDQELESKLSKGAELMDGLTISMFVDDSMSAIIRLSLGRNAISTFNIRALN